MTMIADLDMSVLPVDTMRQVLGIDPWHFWQMRTPTGCSGVYTHYRWTGDNGPGRFDYIQALVMAEQQLAQKLDYWPGLRYDQGEIIRMVTPRQPVLYNRTPMKLETRWHHIEQVGLRTFTAIQAAFPVVYGASDDVTLAVAVADGVTSEEIVVCYAGTTTPIRPIKVTVSANVATITIKKWLMGDPLLWESDAIIDPADNDNLLGTVDVYRVTYDQTHSILLAWEPEVQQCGCLQEDCAICANATHLACAVRGDYKNGLIGWQAGEYSVLNSRWLGHTFPSTRWPDIAYVNYQHGVNPYPDRYMSMYWSQIVAHFAVSFLDEAGCGCSEVLNSLRYWMEDMGLVKDTSRQLGPSNIDNPYGTKRGQIAAWNAVLMHIGD